MKEVLANLTMVRDFINAVQDAKPFTDTVLHESIINMLWSLYNEIGTRGKNRSVANKTFKLWDISAYCTEIRNFRKTYNVTCFENDVLARLEDFMNALRRTYVEEIKNKS